MLSIVYLHSFSNVVVVVFFISIFHNICIRCFSTENQFFLLLLLLSSYRHFRIMCVLAYRYDCYFVINLNFIYFLSTQCTCGKLYLQNMISICAPLHWLYIHIWIGSYVLKQAFRWSACRHRHYWCCRSFENEAKSFYLFMKFTQNYIFISVQNPIGFPFRFVYTAISSTSSPHFI